MKTIFDQATIDHHFPIRVDGQPSYRDGQRRAIEFAADAFNNGKRIVIIEGPTGSGKSAIGMTLCDMVDKAYYLTATKILQDQLVGEFGDKIVELKGRNAYPCTFYDRFGAEMVSRKIWNLQTLQEQADKHRTCADGFCKSKAGKSMMVAGNRQQCLKCFTPSGPNGNGRPSGDLVVLPPGSRYSACPYYEQVYQAVNGRKVVMNFSSFLYQTQMTKRFDEPRDLLTIDECHNVEPQLMDFVSLTISDLGLQKYNISLPQLDSAEEYAVFFEDTNIHNRLHELMQTAIGDDRTGDAEELARTIYRYNLFLDNIGKTGSEWVHEYETTKGGNHRVTLKPVYVRNMAEKLLFRFAERVVLMSATVLDVDVLCSSLGLPRDQVAAVRLKNRFPVENRPIYFNPVAKMTGGKDSINQWGPALAEGVNKIAYDYTGKRGIIHTHNFTISKYLRDNCKPGAKIRFLFQDDFGNDKRAMLKKHAESQDSILVAPAMHEGIDLAGELSRFQIICKVPYPNFFDNAQLARRVEVDRRYYNWLVALKIVQSYGRSVRSPTDFADTYILDEAFIKFFRDARKMLPEWFVEAIKDQSGKLG